MSAPYPLDLVALVPGKDDRETLEGLFGRHQAMRMRAIRREILVHPGRDPGCFREAPAVLQVYQRRARFALAMFDHEGSGQEARPPREVAGEVEDRLRLSGWDDRARALVVVPELETWVWSDSPHVDTVLGWQGRRPALREWLRETGRVPEGRVKPESPKECFDDAIREARVQRSSALFRQLAERVSLSRCQDPCFAALRDILTAWFPVGGQP